MQTIKMWWFNDTQKPHYIYLDHLYLQDRLAVVEPQTMSLLTFTIPRDKIVLVKQWENGNVLIFGYSAPEENNKI